MHCSCHSASARVAAEFTFFAACGAYGYSRDGAIRTICFLTVGSCGGGERSLTLVRMTGVRHGPNKC
jgi:hypothetical protein